MKSRTSLLLSLAVAVCPIALSAQVAPPPGTAPAAAATPAKKMPLSSADKQLIKSSGEAQLGLLHLSEIMRGQTPPGSAAVQKMAAAATKTVNDSWGEVGTLAIGDMPKTEQTPAEKKEIGELRKLTSDKFDKAYLKAFTRESKRANAAFTSGSKFATDANLKAFYAKWQPIIAKLDADALAAEAESKKK